MSGKATGWVLKNFPVTCAADRTRKLVFIAVADAANQYGEHARPGLAAVSEEWRIGKSSVIRHLNELVAAGWLEVTIRGIGRGHVTVYRIPGMVPEKDLSDTEIVEKGPISEAERSQFSTEKVPDFNSTPTLSTVEINGSNQRSDAAPLALVHSESLSTHPLDERIFEIWVSSTARTARTVLTAQRRRLIRGALSLYGFDDVADAVRGWSRSTFHSGANPDRKVYNDLELILRDAQHIEQFRDYWRGTGSPATARIESDAQRMIRETREREGRS